MLKSIYYLPAHTAQQSQLFQRGHASQLTLTPGSNPFYYSALMNCEQYDEIIEEIQIREDKEEKEWAWLIMAKAAKGLNFLPEKAEMRRIFGDEGLVQSVEKWIERKEFVPRVLPAREEIKYNYEMLLQKAQVQGYFNIPEVPCFLLSIEWLTILYSQQFVPPVSPRPLASPMPFLCTDSSSIHYNYEVIESVQQNHDYKILPYEAWMYLQRIFGGGEVRRYTTPQKKPVVQVKYGKISIMVHEDRCIYAKKMQILVSKFESFQKIVERVKKLLIAYDIVPFKSLKKEWDIIKVSNMTIDQLCEFVHDETILLTDMSNYSKINPKSDIDEAQIFSSKNIVLFNIYEKSQAKKNIFNRVQLQKIIETRQKCLTCGSTSQLVECKCKTVFFCSKICKANHKTHQKQCNAIVKDVKFMNQLMDYYDVRKRCYPNFNQFQKYGKVGFENLGNTCYMNAALQCILRVENISRFFMRNDHIKDLNVGNVLGSQGYLACAYGELVKTYYTTSKRSLQPSSILRIVAKNPQFRGNNHQDSQQFLNYFLDKLHEDLNRVKVKPYTEQVQSNGRPDDIVSKQSWDNYKKRNQSYISEMLAGQYRSEIRCPDCDKISITFDPFMSVTLNFPKEEKTQIVEGYFMSPEGEYMKIVVEAPLKMLAKDFCQKTFFQKVIGVYIHEKRIKTEWMQNKSLLLNISKGVLFFFVKPQNAVIDLKIEILNSAKQLDSFTRRVYVASIQTREEFQHLIFNVVKKPLLKALQNPTLEESNQQYLKYITQNHVINILNIYPQVFFPINHQQSVRIQIQINRQNAQFKQAPKFSSSTRQYIKKESIPIKKIGNTISISTLLQGFSEPEQLTQENTWYCNKCKGHKLAQKIMSIYKLPEYLIMHLKRFNHRGGRYVIYGQKVKTPVDLSQFEVIDGIRYELLGVVNHFGSLTFGHYTAYVKKDGWFYYDDESVKKSNVNGDNAYLVFYHRVS